MPKGKPVMKKSSPAKPGTPMEAAQAFALIEPELADVHEVVPINVDISRAVAVAIGAVPHLQALRPQLVEELPKHPVAQLDKLQAYALGAWYAHLLALPNAVSEDALKRLLDEAAPLREDLLVAAEALAHKRYVDATRVADIRKGQGHIDTANDLVALAALFGESWDAVSSKTTVVWEDVERASRLGPELLVALGARNQPGIAAPKAVDPAERRARAFTLLVNAYDACRRAVAYLRWNEGDVDAIAPSLFAKNGRKTSSTRSDNSSGASGGDAAPEPKPPVVAPPVTPPPAAAPPAH